MKGDTMKEGKLFFDGERYDIRYPDGGEYGGLHCGNIIVVMVDGKWRTARIEYNDTKGWYLFSFDLNPEAIAFQGLPVRI